MRSNQGQDLMKCRQIFCKSLGADRGSDHGVKSIIIPVVIFPFFPESSGIISYFFAREFWNYFHLWIDFLFGSFMIYKGSPNKRYIFI